MGIFDILGALPQGIAEGASQMNMSPLDQMLLQTKPQLTQNKGMFGIHGTGRDLLGILGDSLLVGAGGDRVYKPGRDQEEAAGIMQEYALNPQAAIARLNKVAPDLAQKYQVAYDKNQYDLAKDAPQKESRFITTAGGWLGAANERTYKPIVENLRKKAAAEGISTTFLDNLPSEYGDGEDVKAWVRGTMEPKDQYNVDYRNARAEDFDADRAERIRHNQTAEGISRTNAGTAKENLAVRQANAGKKKEVDSYTGDDGYRYTSWDDGTTTRSTNKTREPAKKGRAGRAGGSSTSQPPNPPARAGHTVRNPSTGEVWYSPDGKSWVKK